MCGLVLRRAGLWKDFGLGVTTKHSGHGVLISFWLFHIYQKVSGYEYNNTWVCFTRNQKSDWYGNKKNQIHEIAEFSQSKKLRDI